MFGGDVWWWVRGGMLWDGDAVIIGVERSMCKSSPPYKSV